MSDEHIGTKKPASFEDIQASLEASTKKELQVDSALSTGACCLTGIGFQQCFNGTTFKGCNDAAFAQGLQFSWHTGKSCNQINCPKK